MFDSISPVISDFVYLDGSDCDQVKGKVNGILVCFGSDEYKGQLPMAADLIQLKPIFFPGAFIVTDGRGANAFLRKNDFRRE